MPRATPPDDCAYRDRVRRRKNRRFRPFSFLGSRRPMVHDSPLHAVDSELCTASIIMPMQAESLEVLEKADVPPSQARAIVRAIEIEITGASHTLATKHDVLLLRQEISELRGELREEISGLRGELR